MTSATRAMPSLSTIPSVFRDRAREHPERVALLSGNEQLTYAQLDRASDTLAARLLMSGVRPGDAVAVVGKRCPAMIATLLAVAKARATTVPLDPAYPAARLQFLIQDSGSVRILDFAPCTEVLRSMPAPCEDIALPHESSTATLPDTAPSDLAYLTYTSGSTGAPKGVEIEHSSIVHLALHGGVFDWTPPQTLLHMASLSFDLAQFEIWGALLNGITLALLPGPASDWKLLSATLRKHSVTIANIPTALFHQMMEEDPHLLDGLQQILIGGEALSAKHLRMGMHALPGVRFVNAYGPTESTVIATFYEIPVDFASGSEAENSVPIGRAVPGTEIRIVNAALGEITPGCTGELLLAGRGLARGYRNRPELNGEKFPMLEGKRWYRTGDLVRQRSDGLLEFAGRLDTQLKVRGYRIEAGEVESALIEQPGVTRAVVTAHRDRLLGFITGRDSLDTAALADTLASRLPAYMVPDIYQVPIFPLTVHGKIDLVALIDGAMLRARQQTSIPATSMENTLLSIWSGVLGEQAADLDTPFGEMGGSSMHLARIHHRLEQTLGREIPITEIFQYPTIRLLAAHLQCSGTDNRRETDRMTRRRDALARMRPRAQRP